MGATHEHWRPTGTYLPGGGGGGGHCRIDRQYIHLFVSYWTGDQLVLTYLGGGGGGGGTVILTGNIYICL